MKEIYEYEHGLPEYLQHDLDMYKEGLRTNSNLLDCYWGELYGSINGAEIDDGAITPDHVYHQPQLQGILRLRIKIIMRKNENLMQSYQR